MEQEIQGANILNVAFYKFCDLSQASGCDLPSLRNELKAKCLGLKLKGTILLSLEGINGFLAGDPEPIREFLKTLRELSFFRGIESTFKESVSQKQPFTRMVVKVKKEIISMGCPEIKPHLSTGKRISPQELKNWFDEKKDFVLVDTRNDYEVKLGTFQNAIDYDLKAFRQFPKKLLSRKEEIQNKPVVMFCTGGIRCEKATALASDIGISDVYQLDGGILRYFEECGGSYYKGECFVFDHRVAVDPNLKETKTTQCYGCRHVITPEEQLSSFYIPGRQCQYCAKTSETSVNYSI